MSEKIDAALTPLELERLIQAGIVTVPLKMIPQPQAKEPDKKLKSEPIERSEHRELIKAKLQAGTFKEETLVNALELWFRAVSIFGREP